MNHRGWNENPNRDEKDQKGSYQMDPIALNYLNIDLDWSQFLKYREMPVFEQISSWTPILYCNIGVHDQPQK